MGIAIVILAVLFFFVMVIKSNNKMKEVYKSNSIRDIVMSVNHGRIYPFFTGMNLERAKSAAKKAHPNPVEFEQTLQLQELMGIAPYFDIEISNEYIERISVMLNKNGVVSSIGIDIKNFDANITPLINEMANKFGRPISMDNEFIIWREGCMVINISKTGSLNVIDERLFGR